MAEHALGYVTSASTTTATRATTNESNPLARLAAQAIQFQQIPGQTGGVRIVSQQTPTLSRHTLAYIPPPSTGPPETCPAWVIGNPAGPNSFNVANYWVLPNVIGEGVNITVVKT